MPQNESTIDRIIRAILGIIIFYAAYTLLTGVLLLVGYAIGLALIFTAVTGYCHLYKIMGMSTKK